MTRRALIGLGAAGVVVASYVASAPARSAPSPRSSARPIAVAVDGLPTARVTADARRGELVIELPPVDLPAGEGHQGTDQPPVSRVALPVGGAIYGFRTELIDKTGRRLPPQLIHHFNVLDPSHRELFLPIAQRIAAGGKETGVIRMPRLLFGSPFTRGSTVVASAMLHNPTAESYRGVRVRLVLYYTPENRPWPLFRAFPWQLDVGFPVGDKSFDLPPGRSARAYEGSPAVAGDIVVIGGHLHEYGVSIELSDATTGEQIWRAQPVRDQNGDVVAMPIGKLYGLSHIGARIVPEHRYRVRVVYDNPTGKVLPEGGMGVVAGLFVPDGDVPWPTVNPNDSLYQEDLRHFLRLHGVWQEARHGGAPIHHH
ncbi:MAG: hypothetical protein ACREN5_14270 [Gemmatimonadales bacterium]